MMSTWLTVIATSPDVHTVPVPATLWVDHFRKAVKEFPVSRMTST
jgi:hypothetical protein